MQVVLLLLAALAASASPVFLTEFKLTTDETDVAASVRAFLAAIGVLMSVVQWTMIKAYGIGEASAIAPMEYGRLLFATVAGIWVFAEVPTVYTLVGATLIIASTLYTVHRNRLRQAPAAAKEAE